MLVNKQKSWPREVGHCEDWLHWGIGNEVHQELGLIKEFQQLWTGAQNN